MDEGTRFGLFFLGGTLLGGVIIPFAHEWIEQWRSKRRWDAFEKEYERKEE